MGLDRQFLVEILDGQGQQVARLIASNINVVSSKVTGSTPGTATSIATYAGNGQSGTAGANIAIPDPSVVVTVPVEVVPDPPPWNHVTVEPATGIPLASFTMTAGGTVMFWPTVPLWPFPR